MSQAGLAKACGWSSQSRVGNYESGTREPTLADLEKIAAAVGASVAELTYGEPCQATPPEPARQGRADVAANDGPLTVSGLLEQLRLSPDGIPDPRLKAALINLLTQYQEDPNRGAEIAAAILTLTKKD